MSKADQDQITVRKENKEELSRRKIAAEHKLGKEITWDTFLLEATK